MAFGSIIRKSAASFPPLARRAVRSYRPAINHSSIPAAKASPSPFPPTNHHHFFSTKADEPLLKALEAGIHYAEEAVHQKRVEEIPNGFPFEIEDNPGCQTVTLRRNYQGEEIIAEICMPDLVSDDDVDDNDKATQSSIPLVVNIVKGDGPCLEFGCTAYPDEIIIDYLSFKSPETSQDQMYEGHDFQDLDENLQKAFHKYLETRGIKPRTINFFYEYMIAKDSREYLMWLKNLKKFVEA